MKSLSSHWWWDLSTREFAERDMGEIVAILPVGAVEQHGPHLPVRVDAAINAGILARAVALMPPDLPALVMPALPVGKSNEHLAFPGTLSLRTTCWRGCGSRWRRAPGGRGCGASSCSTPMAGSRR